MRVQRCGLGQHHPLLPPHSGVQHTRPLVFHPLHEVSQKELIFAVFF
jgi:hypothetical protein